MDTTHLTTLALPIPPMLEAVLGYSDPARWVAFFWGAGDEARYADGRLERDADWYGYRTFVEHPTVTAALEGYDLGSSERPATHWLILDRDARTLFIAPAQEAAAFLTSQWVPTGVLTMETAPETDLDDLADPFGPHAWEITTIHIDVAAVMRNLRERSSQVQTLTEWLAAHMPQPDRAVQQRRLAALRERFGMHAQRERE